MVTNQKFYIVVKHSLIKTDGGKKMASPALEQMLVNEPVSTIGQDRMYQTIDKYTAGTTVLYSFDPPNLLD